MTSKLRRSLRARTLLAVGLLAAGMGATGMGTVRAEPSADPNDPAALRRELQAEQARIKELERRLDALEAARHGTGATAGNAQSAQPAQAASAAAPANPAAPAPLAPPTPNAIVAIIPPAGAVSPQSTLVGSFGPQGFTLATADGQNAIHFRGNLSVDDREFVDSNTPASADTLLIRKLRPTLEGTLEGMFDFRFMPDFGQGKTVLQDAWGDARIEPWLIVTAGKFKAPVGLERLQLEQFARFIEPSLTADLLPYRDIGVQLSGALGHGVLGYQAGIFDGAPDGGSSEANSVPDMDSTGKYTVDGRVFSQPFVLSDWPALHGLGLGIAGTYVNASGVASVTVSGATTTVTTTSLLSSYKTTGQQPLFSYRGDSAVGFNNATIASGIERRWVPQAFYYYGSFGLLGEYVQEDQQVARAVAASVHRAASLTHEAWQIQGYCFLTGEEEGYDRGKPLRPVGRGGWGAWELVARFHSLSFDPAAFAHGSNSFANPATAVRAARAYGLGLNWYLTGNLKIQLDYEHTRFEGGAVMGDRPQEEVLTTQFALIF